MSRGFSRIARARIGVRLGLCFLALGILMLAGGCFSLWHIHRLEQRVHRLNNLDSAVFVMLQADNMMARFAERLRAAIMARDIISYREAANEIQRENDAKIDRAMNAVQAAPDLPSDAKVAAMLLYWKTMVPDYLRRTTRIATLGDWPAVERRTAVNWLTSQLDSTISFWRWSRRLTANAKRLSRKSGAPNETHSSHYCLWASSSPLPELFWVIP